MDVFKFKKVVIICVFINGVGNWLKVYLNIFKFLL